MGILLKIALLELIKWISGHCSTIMSRNCPKQQSSTLKQPVPKAKHQLLKFGHAQKARLRGGKTFWQSFFDLKIRWKGRLVVGILGSTLNGFLPFYLASLNESCSFRFGLKDLFLIHTFDDNIVLGWVN